MELSFCDLRAKEVINVCDGRRLGNIIDLIIDCRCASVTGIVVPYDKGFFHFFKSNQDIFIPWNRICKIGRDVILVELNPSNMPIACSAPIGFETLSKTPDALYPNGFESIGAQSLSTSSEQNNVK